VIALAVISALAMSPAQNRERPDAGVRAVGSAQHPVAIDADFLDIKGKKQEALWIGHVVIVRGTTHVTCDRMLAHYTQTQEITRVECNGNVVVVDGDKWARGDHADFDFATGILIVTGSPEAKQGANHVRGTKVTFQVGRDLIQVENARAVVESSPQGGPVLPKVEPKKEKSTP